jgi:hypothetical protein
MKLNLDQAGWQVLQVPHFIAIACLNMHIDPDDTEAIKANSEEIYGRATAMIKGMNAYLKACESQRKGKLNG